MEGRRRCHLGARHAAAGVVELAVVGDHLAQVEEPPLGRDEPDEIRGDPVDAFPGKDGVERLELVGGGEHGTADEPLEVGASGDERVELAELLGDGLCLAAFVRKVEERGGVAAGHAGNE